MTAVASDKFRIRNAQDFLNLVGDTVNQSFYVFIGKVTAWPSPNSDVSPPTPSDSVEEFEYELWRDQLGAKRLSSQHITRAVPRYDWTTGTVYDQYSYVDGFLFDKDFYVMTDEYNVYKVLSNNGGAQSTVKPTGTSNVVITTADGYRWKYMYTLTPYQTEFFLTDQFIPVPELAAQPASNSFPDGSIESFTVSAGGSGYTDGTHNVVITGDGTTATGVATISGGVVTKVEPGLTTGSGYTWTTVTLPGGAGAGTGAVIKANISPRGGHGSNVAMELGAHYCLIGVNLEYSESGTLTTNNDFRKVGIVRDPYLFGTTTIATGNNYRQTNRYTLTSITGTFLPDEIVTATGDKSAAVVEWDSVNAYLYTTDNKTPFSNGNVLTGGTSGATATISAVSDPGLDLYSGNILYGEYRSPISRDADQVESIRLVVEM